MICVTIEEKKKATTAKTALIKNININYNNTKKLANCITRNYPCCRETLEIVSNNKTCNTMKHLYIDEQWEIIFKKCNLHGRRECERQRINVNPQSSIFNAEEGDGTYQMWYT